MDIVCLLLFLFEIVLLARVLMSWFPMPPGGPVRRVFGVVYSLTEPVLRPVRGLLPPIRFGMGAFDLSPIIVFIVLGIIQQAIC